MYPVNFYPFQMMPYCPLAYQPVPYIYDDDLTDGLQDDLFRSEEEENNEPKVTEQNESEAVEDNIRQQPIQGQAGPEAAGFGQIPGGQFFPGFPGFPGLPGFPVFPPLRPAEIARQIEVTNPDILRTMLSYRIPVAEARRLMTRIVREALRYCR